MRRFLIFLYLPVLLFGQEFTVSVDDTIAYGGQYDDLYAEGQIYNNTAAPLTVSMVRTAENLPNQLWYSFLCLADQCLAPFVDSTATIIAAGDSSYYAVHISTQDSVPAVASVRIQFKTPNETTTFSQTFYGSTMPSAIGTSENAVPGQFILFNNYPNPFNNQTVISVKSPGGKLNLKIYDMLGKLIYSTSLETRIGQYTKFYWDGNNENGMAMTSGVYFYKVNLTDDGKLRQSKTKKMILVR